MERMENEMVFCLIFLFIGGFIRILTDMAKLSPWQWF
jgi:hypothetical protein